MKSRVRTPLLAAICALAAAAAAEPTSPANPEIVTFAPADFDRFAPRTALDLVEQMPGFSVRRGDTGQRGFGQASGNVLINGQRIISKDDSAEDVLKRIAAAGVARLEIFDGALSTVPGLSGQVVNVILANDSFSGTFSWAPRFDQGDTPMISEGELSLKGTRGRLGYHLGIESSGYKRGRIGSETLYDGSGERLEERDRQTYYYHTDPTLVAGLSVDHWDGSRLTLASKYRRRFVDHNENYDAYRMAIGGDPDRLRRFASTERERSGELGADYEFDLGTGRLKLIGLYRFEHSPYQNELRVEYAAGTPNEHSRYNNVQDEAEKILRGEYSWHHGDTHSWQFSAEVAHNTLEAQAQFERVAANGDVTTIDLANADASVEESRREFNLSYGRPLTDSLSVQMSLGVENSELSQSGAQGQTREFVRAKGFASLAWRVSEQWSLSTKLARKVGQLDFDDFVASVDLKNDTADAGNPNLVPSQTWLLELQSAHNLGALGVINLRLYREFIADIVDQIPIGDTAEAPGNIDRADRYGIASTSTIQLDPLGLPGVRLNLDANYRNSEVADPLTGEPRPLSGEEIAKLDMEIRHDIQRTDIAWGVKVYRDWEADKVRLNQLSTERKGFWFGVFAEHKDLFGLKGRIELQDISRRDAFYSRDRYPLRRTAELISHRETRMTDGLGVILTISGDF